jgi:hypothetical protein
MMLTKKTNEQFESENQFPNEQMNKDEEQFTCTYFSPFTKKENTVARRTIVLSQQNFITIIP